MGIFYFVVVLQFAPSWGLLFAPMKLYQPKYCNCLFWAICMWFRHGGYIKPIKSKYGWWWHFIYVKDGVEYEYSPLHPLHNLILPPPIFRGEARELKE